MSRQFIGNNRRHRQLQYTYLGHGVSQGVLVLLPVLAKVSASLLVPVSVVNEDSCLLDVLFISVGLLLGFGGTEFVVFRSTQTGRNIRLAVFNLSDLQLLNMEFESVGSKTDVLHNI
jgi:hypothetical protein